MAEEFNPITTQEQLDSLIKERINRLNEKHQKELDEFKTKYSDYDELKTNSLNYSNDLEKLQKKVSDYETQIKEMDTKVKAYELHSVKQQIAIDAGIPLALADKLSGTTTEELRKDAEQMASYVVKDVRVAPMQAESAVKDADAVSAIFKQMNPHLKI